jgi:glycosyltransferase involved in cell wall biosynthesis
MSTPRVSVIIPVFNGERFLGEAITSVLDQDHRPIEIVVVDDGSSDASAEIATAFDHVVLLRQRNGGPAAARNAGVDRSSGELITFLDADDLMTRERLTSQVRHLRAHPEVGCVLMNQEVVLEPGMSLPGWVTPFDEPDEVVAGLIITAMIRRETFLAVGGFDASYRLCEDVDLMFRIREAGVEMAFLPTVGVLRRIHPGNVSHQVEAMRDALTRVVRERLERIRAVTSGDQG